MGVSRISGYGFVGTHPVAEANSLLDALYDLLDLWLSKPSLASLLPGMMQISLGIGSTKIEFDLTDRKVLEDFVYNPDAVLEHLAGRMGVSRDEAMQMLRQADEARIEVVEIMDPSGLHSPIEEPDRTIERVAPAYVQDAYREQFKLLERSSDRRSGQRRSREERDLIWHALEHGRRHGLSERQLADQLGVTTSTIRRVRLDHEPEVILRPGRAPTRQEMKKVQRVIAKTRGNVAKAAERLDMPRSTLRDLVTRDLYRTQRAEASKRSRDELHDEVLARVTMGRSASQAAREVGVSERTARRWVAEARDKE